MPHFQVEITWMGTEREKDSKTYIKGNFTWKGADFCEMWKLSSDWFDENNKQVRSKIVAKIEGGRRHCSGGDGSMSDHSC